MAQVDDLKCIIIDAADSGYGDKMLTAHKFARRLMDLTMFRTRINDAFRGTTASKRQQVACLEGIINTMIGDGLLTHGHKTIDVARSKDSVPAA